MERQIIKEIMAVVTVKTIDGKWYLHEQYEDDNGNIMGKTRLIGPIPWELLEAAQFDLVRDIKNQFKAFKDTLDRNLLSVENKE